MAMDADGRLFVADRGNNRIQIFDQEGKYLTEWKQFSRPSGLYIRDGLIYVSDSETNVDNHPGGWRRGVRVGDVKTGEVKYFVPWLPESNADAAPSGMEGVAVDASGAIYGSNVYLRNFFPGGPWGEIRKFIKQ
jgi:DNA-binding beta-propeller fold protein YncE